MKSSKLGMNVNLKRVGILSLMILSLAVGKVTADDSSDFKMWHVPAKEDSKGELLKHMESSSDKADSVKWLVTEPSKENAEKFISKFAKEPFMFMEGMKEAITASKKDNKLDAFKKMIEEKFFAGKPDGWDIKKGAFSDEDTKEAFKKLVSKLLSLEKIDDKFLEKLFDKKTLIQAALNVTQKNPNVKPSPSPEVSPSPSPSPSVKPAPSTSPAPSAAPRPQPPVGEIYNDADLQRQAQQICNQVNGKREEDLKKFSEQLNPLRDALNDLANKVAEGPEAFTPNQNQRRNERGLEDVLPGLLANALNKDNERGEVTPAQTAQIPPQAPQRRDNTDPNQFNQPLPDQGQVPQQPSFPMPQPYSNNNFGPIRLDLPSMSGRQELRDAQDVLTEIQMRQPVAATLGMNAGIPELVLAKAKIATLSRKAQGALFAAKDRLSRLDEQLEELKDGGRAALPESAKRKMAELERAVNEAKSQAQYQQQILNMLPPEQKQASMGEILGAQQKVQAAESALNQYKAEVDMAIESGNAKIKSLAKVRDGLQSTVSKLESEVGGLKEDESSVQQLINTNMQLQMQQMQPMQAGTANINKLAGGGVSGQPRTQAPRLGNSLQSAPMGATGGEVRGSLGSKKN